MYTDRPRIVGLYTETQMAPLNGFNISYFIFINLFHFILILINVINFYFINLS
jgi:hypothetical protein